MTPNQAQYISSKVGYKVPSDADLTDLEAQGVDLERMYIVPCPDCDGMGKVMREIFTHDSRESSGHSRREFWDNCPECRGSGSTTKAGEYLNDGDIEYLKNEGEIENV